MARGGNTSSVKDIVSWLWMMEPPSWRAITSRIIYSGCGKSIGTKIRIIWPIHLMPVTSFISLQSFWNRFQTMLMNLLWRLVSFLTSGAIEDTKVHLNWYKKMTLCCDWSLTVYFSCNWPWESHKINKNQYN